MNDNTYERVDSNEIYETYEWDNVWMEHLSKKNKKRVAYIGDSISQGVRRLATAVANEDVLFDGYATSKAVDNPCFKDMIDIFIGQLPPVDKIIFNNGLHGWHLEDDNTYKKYYEEMILFLKSKYESAELILVLTTAVSDKERNERVKIRNKSVIELAKKYSLSIVDLYSLVEENIDLLTGDGVHPNAELCSKIAEYIVEKVK